MPVLFRHCCLWRISRGSCLCQEDGGRCKQAAKHLTMLFVFTFLFVLPAVCYKYRYSIYHIEPRTRSEEVAFMKQENADRLKAAREILLQQKKSVTVEKESIQLPAKIPDVDVAITVITMSRNRQKFKRRNSFQPMYLTQIVSRYVQLMKTKAAQLKHYKLFLCNIDPHPITYYEFRNLTLDNEFSYFQRFPDQQDPVKVRGIFAKEKDDYVYCLNRSIDTGAKNILLVEDDALPLDDVFSTVNYVIDFHLHTDQFGIRTRQTNFQRTEPTAYVKLYHPDRLLGYWSPELDRIPQLIASGLCFGSLLFVAYSYITATYMRPGTNAFWLWAAFVLYIALICIAIGRQNLIEWRRISSQFYVYTSTASCCTPALLFPREGAIKVAGYLTPIECGFTKAKDYALDKFRKETGSKAFMVQPNVFKHIGLYSSLRREILNPFVV